MAEQRKKFGRRVHLRSVAVLVVASLLVGVPPLLQVPGASHSARIEAGSFDPLERSAADTNVTLSRRDRSVASEQIPRTQLKLNPFGAPLPAASAPAQESNAGATSDDRAAVLKAVAGFRLQAVMMEGGRGTCMINNVVCQEGQELDGFTIESIAGNIVVVRSGIYRFELKAEG